MHKQDWQNLPYFQGPSSRSSSERKCQIKDGLSIGQHDFPRQFDSSSGQGILWRHMWTLILLSWSKNYFYILAFLYINGKYKFLNWATFFKINKLDECEVWTWFMKNCDQLISPLQITASLLSGSISIISSMVDSLVDLTSGFVISISTCLIKKRDPYLYPRGRTRLEPLSLVDDSLSFIILYIFISDINLGDYGNGLGAVDNPIRVQDSWRGYVGSA